MDPTTKPRASADGPPQAIGDLQVSQYYQLPDDSIIPIDPLNPEKARAALPGPVLFSYPDAWEPGADNARLQELYGGDRPDIEYFREPQFLPIGGSFMMAPGSGMPIMDPYGILNPAAIPPINPAPPKGHSVLQGLHRDHAAARRKRFFGCC